MATRRKIIKLTAVQPECGACHCWHEEAEQKGVGQCKRYPPQLCWDDEGVLSVFPTTTKDDVCGEFRAKH